MVSAELPAASAIGLSDPAVLRPGARANLVVFDPVLVEDRATFEDPLQPPVGVRDVLVGGAFAVRDGRPTTDRPGNVVR